MIELSPKVKNRLERARAEAHKRVVKRGIVQFRANEELMEQLLAISDHKKTAVGVLIRSWIAPIVKHEFESLPLQSVPLPNGRILTRDSNYKDVKAAIQTFKKGSLNLTIRQYQTLCNWFPNELRQ